MFKCTFTLLCNRCHHPSLELFSFCKTKTLLPLKNNSPFPPPPASDNRNSTLRLYEFDDSRYLMSVESYGICLFVSSLFHLFYNPSAVHKIPVSPHLLQHLLFSGILIATIPMGMMCYLIEVLICILLMISDVEYLFMCLLAIRISSLEKYLFQSFAYVFNWVVYFFGCWAVEVVYTFWILTPYQICN